MTSRKHSPIARVALTLATALCVMALGGCSALRPATVTPHAFYALSAPTGVAVPPERVDPQRKLRTLIITPPHAASGFDSQRIIYVRNDHQLEYFSYSEWVDPPARMLGPLIATALERSGAFAAVVMTPASAAGDQRLDTEIVRLQHNFQSLPSRVQFTLRATLVDDKTRQVLASREFSDEVAASNDSPQGSVTAANQVVQRVLDKLAQMVAHVPNR